MATDLLNELQTAELLADAETKIGDIYRLFSGLFPADADFWNKLAQEEDAHARWVQALLPRVKGRQVTFRERRLGSPAFTLFHDYLVQKLREIRMTPPTEIAALAVAVDIETTLVEKCFYEVFQGADDESARLLVLLNRSSDAHQRTVKQHWLLKHAKP